MGTSHRPTVHCLTKRSNILLCLLRERRSEGVGFLEQARQVLHRDTHTVGGDKGRYGLNALGRWRGEGGEGRGEEEGEGIGVTIDIHSLLRLAPFPDSAPRLGSGVWE